MGRFDLGIAMAREQILTSMYEAMLARLGPCDWWPAQTPFEVMLGAVLTQNTAWSNVEKALDNLRAANLMDARELDRLDAERLAELIRPSGFYRLKAQRLKGLLAWLRDSCDYDIKRLKEEDVASLRESLLAVRGIGPETADSILLYALEKPSFVVDAYTRRVFSRHGMVPEDVEYGELRDFFQDVLPLDVALFNEYHALIVRVCKEWCKKNNPRCEECPLRDFLEHAL